MMPLLEDEIPSGIDRGHLQCQHHQGVVSIRKKTCCGGSVVVRAVVQCVEKGEVVVGKTRCDSHCRRISVG